MNCICKQFHYFLPTFPGLVTVLRPKAFVSGNISFRLLSNSTAYNNLKCDAVSTTLVKYGFSENQAKLIVTSQPQLQDFDGKSITSNLINWFSFRMSEKDLFRSLTSCPELLLLNPEFVNARVKELLTVFTQKDILKLLKTCPEVFFEDWDVIMEKMEYLLHYMGTEQKTVVKYEALKYSLEHMRRRHTFLLFAGKFKTPNPKKKQNNPHLGKIFGKMSTYLKLTGLSEEEYTAFCEVFPDIEFENLCSSESDTSDSDEDEDNIH